MRRPERFRRAAVLGLALGLAIGLGPRVRAQHTPDPYNIVGEYNSQYEPYMYANQPTGEGYFPNQSRLQERAGYRSANRFQSYIDELDGANGDIDLPASPRRSGAGTPYYRAYRQYDQDFDRLYRPNGAADRTFYSNQQQRNDKYFQAMRETDPRKRAQLLREYNLENLRAARGLSTTRNAPERDRTPPGLLPPDEEEPTEPSRPTVVPPAGARRSPPAATSRATARPGTDARSGLGTTRPINPLIPFNNRSGSGVGTIPRTGRSPSAILERNELRERATRAPSLSAPRPAAPRTTAPPPR